MTQPTATGTNGATNGSGKLKSGPPAELKGRPKPTLESTKFDFQDYQAHPGYGLTVQRIIQIFRAAERGYPIVQCDLFDDVLERDAHLRSEHEKRIEAIAGKDWILQPGGDAPEDADAAAALDERFRAVPNVREMIAHMIGGVNAYGYAGAEILWDRIPGVGGELFGPKWFDLLHPRRFVFVDGEARLLTTAAETDGVTLEAGRFLWMQRGINAPRAGLMRTAVYYSLFKSKALADWVLTNDRYGLPIPYATYNDNTPPPEKDVLAEALQKVGTEFAAMFHESCKMATLQVTGNGTAADVQGGMVNLVDAQISKLFTGATLTSGEGTSAGSYALGRVHENVLYLFTAGDASRLPQMFEHQIARPFMFWNGLPGKPPRLKIHVVKEMDPAARMAIFEAAKAIGLDIDPDQIRQEFQIKTRVGPALPPTPPSSPAPGSPPAAPDIPPPVDPAEGNP